MKKGDRAWLHQEGIITDVEYMGRGSPGHVRVRWPDESEGQVPRAEVTRADVYRVGDEVTMQMGYGRFERVTVTEEARGRPRLAVDGQGVEHKITSPRYLIPGERGVQALEDQRVRERRHEIVERARTRVNELVYTEARETAIDKVARHNLGRGSPVLFPGPFGSPVHIESQAPGTTTVSLESLVNVCRSADRVDKLKDSLRAAIWLLAVVRQELGPETYDRLVDEAKILEQKHG